MGHGGDQFTACMSARTNTLHPAQRAIHPHTCLPYKPTKVGALNARGLRAAFLGSAQTSSAVVSAAWAGEYDYVYLTPELANNAGERLAALQRGRGVSLVAVDEAHCVVRVGVGVGGGWG